MEHVTETRREEGSGAGAPEEMKLFEQWTKPQLAALCQGLDANLQPAAVISKDLMVLHKTPACDALFPGEKGQQFYSLREALGGETCGAVQRSLASGEACSELVRLPGGYYRMHVFPVRDKAVLVFAHDAQRMAGASLAAARQRESAQRLLLRAETLRGNGDGETAAFLRREALRLERGANQLELLCGAAVPEWRAESSADELLAHAQRKLRDLGVTRARVQLPARKIPLWVNAEQILLALMTLVANSLRHGGEQARVCLYALRQGESVVFGVDDDGAGLSDRALARMDDSWRQLDALPGDWGLGVPYARRIAELHGGTLLFLRGAADGCRARLTLPLRQELGLETVSGYQLNLAGSDAVEVELSGVLEPDAFGAP